MPDPNRIYYGRSSVDNPGEVDYTLFASVEGVNGNNILTTGVATQGDYFIVLLPNRFTVSSIKDTVLGNDVTNIFTKVANVRNIDSESYDSYSLGPLNEGVNESYIVAVVV